MSASADLKAYFILETRLDLPATFWVSDVNDEGVISQGINAETLQALTIIT